MESSTAAFVIMHMSLLMGMVHLPIRVHSLPQGVSAEQKIKAMSRLLPETQVEDLFRSAVWENAETDFRKAASRIVGTNFLLYDPMLDSKFKDQVLASDTDKAPAGGAGHSSGAAQQPTADFGPAATSLGGTGGSGVNNLAADYRPNPLFFSGGGGSGGDSDVVDVHGHQQSGGFESGPAPSTAVDDDAGGRPALPPPFRPSRPAPVPVAKPIFYQQVSQHVHNDQQGSAATPTR